MIKRIPDFILNINEFETFSFSSCFISAKMFEMAAESVKQFVTLIFKKNMLALAPLFPNPKKCKVENSLKIERCQKSDIIYKAWRKFELFIFMTSAFYFSEWHPYFKTSNNSKHAFVILFLKCHPHFKNA